MQSNRTELKKLGEKMTCLIKKLYGPHCDPFDYVEKVSVGLDIDKELLMGALYAAGNKGTEYQ